jgi:hypothetical protein
VIPDKDDVAEHREAHGREYPIPELLPVDALHCMEVPRIEQLLRPENVYLMGPDCADVIKGKREIEEKKDLWIQNPTTLADSSPPTSKQG